MKFLFDFFPILLFFIAYKLYGIYAATMVAITATFIQAGWFWFKHHRIEKMHIVTLALIVIFGGATLLLKDEMFIKWKPTVLDWLFALAFLGSQFIGKKTLVERIMATAINLPMNIWTRLNLAWAIFFVFLGCINLYVIYNYDTDTWVNFKLFGATGLTFAFVIIQALFLARYIQPSSETADAKSPPSIRKE